MYLLTWLLQVMPLFFFVGGWAHREDGEIASRVLEDVGRAGATAGDKEAERLATVIGPVRFKPRFRTPREMELIA